MSLHPSLSSAVKGKQQRSVLKRSERIKYLMKKGEWTDASKVFGMPKIKLIRLKVRKEKAEKPEAEDAAAEATEGKAATPAAAEKEKSKEKSK
ncbi:small basic protein [Candidatus Omnitrophota bacterium]